MRYFGDYEIQHEIGRGGMGVVYRARQISLNRLVALKMLRDAALASADELRRFQNEAEAVARLDHPHIVPVYEVGEHDGRRYFSMKLISGPSLHEALSPFAADPRAAAALMVTVAEAVHHAHQRGILHRDLKPPNILLDERGQPHVGDFGLAKQVEGDEGVTPSLAVLGTPGYMAPEQAWGKKRLVTTLSDVYGLGAILYALLTGKAPFCGETVLETLDQVRLQPLVAPSRIAPKVPRDLETICLKCLEKNPVRGYASAEMLAEDLSRYLAGEPILARPVGMAERAVKWARRRPAIAALLGLVALVTALGLGGVLWQWREAVVGRRDAERESGRIPGFRAGSLWGLPPRAPTDQGVRVKDAPGSSRCGIAVPRTTRSFRGDTLVRVSVLGVVPTPRPQRGAPFAPRGPEGPFPRFDTTFGARSQSV